MASTQGDGVNVPTPPSQASWLDALGDNPLTPVAAGGLIGLLVLLGLWRQRRQGADTATPPLQVDFDLDLPDLPPLAPATTPQTMTTAAPTETPSSTPQATAVSQTNAKPMFGIPDISLDLDTNSPHPLEVRLQLAQELWDLGQHHTSRALAEEIVAEASGELQERARQWLAQRS